MKRLPVQLTTAQQRVDEHKRRGAVLIIVLLLMILLLFLGITWFTFASTEYSSATYFADSAHEPYVVSLDADMVFDFTLEQLLLGTRRQQSVLYGGMGSLIPTSIGMLDGNLRPTDMHPFNGQGIHTISSANGALQVDQNRNGNPADDDQTFLEINPLKTNAGIGATMSQVDLDALPTLDVNYTYPDINNRWLSYEGTVAGQKVIIPSFHRPILLRDPNTGVPISNWEQNPNTARRVMRPHPQHLIIGTSTPRYLTATTSGVNAFPFTINVNANGTTGEQGVWSKIAPADATTYIYEWDVDSTGNGTRDAVWMDLDFPKQTLADGRQYVPLMAIRVTDLDSLFNVNAHGKTAQMMHNSYPGTSDPVLRLSLTQPIGNGEYLSKSNMGLSTTEINIGHGLSCDPNSLTYFPSAGASDAAQQQYRAYYGGNAANEVEAANFDLLNLLLGRASYTVTGTLPSESYNPRSPTELQAGRYGEATDNLLNHASTFPRNPGIAPKPGLRASATASQAAGSPTDPGDDDLDRYIGRAMDDLSQWLYPDPLLPGIILPSYVHPLDGSGHGVWTQTGTFGNTIVQGGDPGQPTNPSRWPSYRNFQGGISYDNAISGQLNQNSTRYAWIDHADEVVVDHKYRKTTDSIFGPEELFPLFGSQADVIASGRTSRLRQLMSLNLESNLLAPQIRQRLTTDSWDRRQHNFSLSTRRPWEFNADVNSDSHAEFPPVFVTTTGNATFTNALGQTISKEPFRAEVVAQMGVELKNLGLATLQRQLRLDVNRLCVVDDTWLQRTSSTLRRDNLVGANTTLIPRFRNLMPHPSLNGTGDAVAIPKTVAFPPGTPVQQEYWARVDRQRLARDIYVLLYTLGGGRDGSAFDATNGVNYADVSGGNTDDNSTRTIYTDAQLKVMAQFAVNYVDALDRDNVITKFEYDKNLGDGWNLGDNPYITDDDDSSMPNGDRGVVYGVEAQLLTFSEVIGLISKKDGSGTMDYPCTNYDDRMKDHPFMFVELRNASPFPVTWNNSSWRIRRIPSSGLAPAVQPFVERQLVIKSGSVGAGRQYTIGSQDGTIKFTDPMTGNEIFWASDFRVDYDLSGTFKRIIPHITDATPPQSTTVPTPDPSCDLDLVHDRDQTNRFTLTDGAGTTIRRGGFVYDGTNPLEPAPGLADPFILVLERRVSLTRESPSNSTEEQDNPWVEVDRIEMQGGLVEFTPDSAAANVQTNLQVLRSTERPQPFDRTNEARHIADTNPYSQSTSIGQDTVNTSGFLGNSNTTSLFTRWQPHFDRDFASVIELLSLPLYGPDEVTKKLNPDGSGTASTLFLRPQDPSNDGQPPVSQDLSKNNRWYRLFDALEVPRRMHQQLERELQPQLNARGFATLPRVPGLMQLNTIRYPEVLGGLVDDAMLTRGTLADASEPGRNWWDQFLQARDRRDPISGLVLPGSAVAHPFQPLSYADDDVSSVESTLLRRLIMDNEDLNRDGTLNVGEDVDASGAMSAPAGANEPRKLFEARTNGDLGGNSVDYYTRHRLLSKIHGNTTTRSNVFVVWITVGFFQAIENTPGQVQIGEEITGSTRYRGFFVIDRSDLEGAYNSASRTFDFRKFIKYRQTLQ